MGKFLNIKRKKKKQLRVRCPNRKLGFEIGLEGLDSSTCFTNVVMSLGRSYDYVGVHAASIPVQSISV